MLAVLGLVLAGPTAGSAERRVNPHDPPGERIPPARDGNIAIGEELEAARAEGTIQAYDLFIARHPDHPLARKARAEREQLVRGPSRR